MTLSKIYKNINSKILLSLIRCGKFEFNTEILDIINDASSDLTDGDLPGVKASLDKVKSLVLDKRIKGICFADKRPAGWAAVEEYESDELA